MARSDTKKDFDSKCLEESVERSFDRLEAAASPGLLDVLEVYGGYEEVVQEVDEYLSGTSPEPIVLTSNSST